MIAALPTATFNISLPSTGATSTGATSRIASRYVSKSVATYAGGGDAGPAGSDLAPPSVQQYPVQAVVSAAAPAGMGMGTKVAIFAGITLAVGAAIVVATRR